MVENGKMFSRITCVFGAVKTPLSGPSETVLRLKSLESPGRGTTDGWKFSELLVKINDFFIEIIIIFDIYLCVFDQIWVTVMKNIKVKNILKNMYPGVGSRSGSHGDRS